MKIQGNNKQQGFTLIELVVVIVILGILAATAVPRFADLTTNANSAVASGIVGAIVSSAVIRLGVNTGAADSFANIIGNTDFSSVPAGTTVVATTNMSGANNTISGSAVGGGPITCDAGDSIFTVNVGSSSSTGTLSNSLCSN